MPQHKSAKKRSRQNSKKKLANIVVLNRFRSSLKNFEKSLINGDQDKLEKLIKIVNSLAFKAVKKGIIKKRMASRRISKLAKRIPVKSSK